MRNRVVHSKYKNTGILFELLVRQVTADTLNNKSNSPAIMIIREFLRPTTELGKELVLYRSLVETTNLSEVRANKFLDIILEQCRKLNVNKLNEQKYQLVKKIKDSYPLKEFLSSKIPQYKTYASIYKTFQTELRPNRVDIVDIKEIATARFTLVEHLITLTKEKNRKPTLMEAFKSQQEDLRLLSYRILIDKFNEKYSGLDLKQKKLLREYINNISNTNSLREYINSEVPVVKQKLTKCIRSVDDKITQIKLNEVLNQLDNITKGKIVKENQVTSLLIAYQLVKEIDDVLEDE
ncbi:MAG TPA: hypothetical protein VMX17_03085 [Candidatus Glassbacteria bacterium]|nr:hypothetical protein [Candidatus Glassbacteria bacterium]